jgi:hypothetical protein
VSLVAAGVAIAAPASAGSDFTFGSGFAQASLVVPAINAGELSIPVIMGEAAAGYQDETGRATSTLFSIPLLGATSSGGTKCGVPSSGLSLPLPPPLYSDTSSTNNKKNVDKTENTDGLGVVKQETHAKPNSSGDSIINLTDYELPGLVRIGSATGHAVTEANADKETRRSNAITRVADVTLLGGLVRITGMRWEITQTRNGTDSRTSQPKTDHTFSFDGLVANGIKIPIATPGGAAAAVATANGLLKPHGLSFELPKFVDNGKGRQSMTPFVVKIGGPDFLLTPVLGTVLSNEQVVNLQADLFKALFDPQNCQELNGLIQRISPQLNAQYNTIGGVAPLLTAALMGFLSGGSTTLSIGGVTVSLDDQYYPPLSFGGPNFVQAPGAPAVPAVQGSQTSALPRIRSIAGKDSVSTKSSDCHTSSPAGKPGCWRGLAPLGAALAGVVAVGSLAADELTTRRRVKRDVIG